MRTEATGLPQGHSDSSSHMADTTQGGRGDTTHGRVGKDTPAAWES